MEAAEITNCDVCNGGLKFNTAGALPEIDLLNGYAWCVTDTSDLWKLEVRGDDRVLAGVAGRRAHPRELDAVTMQFPMVVVGKYTKDGAVNVDPSAGLDINLMYLRTNLELPIASGNGTRQMTWTRESGGTPLTANVHVIPPMQHKVGSGYLARLVLEVSVPSGRFT